MKISTFAHLVAFHWQLCRVTATPVNNPASTGIVPYVEKRQFKVVVDCNELINQVLRTLNAYPYDTGQAVADGKKGAVSATLQKRSELRYEHAENYLRSAGAEFESITVWPLLDRSKESGHSVQDIRTDFRVTSRFDGSGNVDAIPFTEDTVARRASTPGFKIAWEDSCGWTRRLAVQAVDKCNK
ncbi:hypothetical protein F4818DRAFT_441822 [Hypoxylon cercidicola]|nr:hypothetical protein F4818DRAFT_441822 [Hypoxylon cercidicola]